MKCLFMYNPRSGNGAIAKKIPYILGKLEALYSKVDIFCTKKPKDMTVAAKNACGVYDIIVFSGGDGSFNEVLQGIATMPNKPMLGYLPAGTVNDIARALKIPRTLSGALKNLAKGSVKPYDIMKVNDNYAMYCVCCGAFTSASYLAPQSEKKTLGRIAYGLQGLRANMHFKTFNVGITGNDVTINSQTVFVLIMNGKSVAGFKINDSGKMDDGILEAVIVKQQKNPTLLMRVRAFFKVLKVFVVRYNRLREKDIERFQGDSFKFEVDDNVVWNFDGEMGASGAIEISVLQKHINIIVPTNN